MWKKHTKLLRWNLYGLVFLLVLTLLHPLIAPPNDIPETAIFLPNCSIVHTPTKPSQHLQWLGWTLPWQGQLLGTINMTQRLPQYPMRLALRHKVDRLTRQTAETLAAQHGANAVWTQKSWYYRDSHGHVLHQYQGQALRLPESSKDQKPRKK